MPKRKRAMRESLDAENAGMRESFGCRAEARRIEVLGFSEPVLMRASGADGLGTQMDACRS